MPALILIQCHSRNCYKSYQAKGQGEEGKVSVINKERYLVVFKCHSHLWGELEREKITLYLETSLLRCSLLSASVPLLFIAKCCVLRKRG